MKMKKSEVILEQGTEKFGEVFNECATWLGYMLCNSVSDAIEAIDILEELDSKYEGD
jgi:hypothetical protein